MSGQAHAAAVPPLGVASRRICDRLEAEILDGTLRPADRIRQDELAERFNVSRIPVREALRMLETVGLVSVVSNSGAWVRSLSLEECTELYLMRERLEPLLLARSIPKLTDADIEEIGLLADRLEAVDTYDDFIEVDRQFHLTAYRGSPEGFLMDTVLQLWNVTQAYRRSITRLADEHRVEILRSEHRLLADAISQRNPADAGELLGLHIRRTRLTLTQHPEVFRS
jgi:DNA-binding GntR family transcriptional regulator